MCGVSGAPRFPSAPGLWQGLSGPASAGPGDATRPHSNFRRHWRCGRAAPVPRSNFRRLWPRAAGDCRRCTWRPGAGDRSTWRYGSSPSPPPGSRGLGLAKAVKSWSRRGLPAAPPAKAVESWSGTSRRRPWGLPQPAPPPLCHRLRDPRGEDSRAPRGDGRRSACGGVGGAIGSHSLVQRVDARQVRDLSFVGFHESKALSLGKSPRKRVMRRAAFAALMIPVPPRGGAPSERIASRAAAIMDGHKPRLPAIRGMQRWRAARDRC